MEKTVKTIIQTGAVLAFFAVILGAFGAHGLKDSISAERLASFETGVRYQMYHGLGMVLTGLCLKLFPQRLIRLSAWLMLVGVLLFSGSIYLLATRELTGLEGTAWLGPVTPIGGTFMIASWVLFFIGIGKAKLH